MNYFGKMKGIQKSPPVVSLSEIAWSWIGAFAGISAVGVIHYNLLAGNDLIMIIGSFGASAVLIYGAIGSPLAQPRNLVGGHILSAIIGVASYQMFNGTLWFAAAFVLLGSPTINKGILVSVAGMIEEIRGLKFKNKKAAAFGSYGWSGESVKMISEKLTSAGFEIVDDGLKILWNPDNESKTKCFEYGKMFVANISS